jgi:hypothetical protein
VKPSGDAGRKFVASKNFFRQFFVAYRRAAPATQRTRVIAPIAKNVHLCVAATIRLFQTNTRQATAHEAPANAGD